MIVNKNTHIKKIGTYDLYSDNAVTCHCQRDEDARHCRIRGRLAAAFLSAIFSTVAEKKNLIPERKIRPDDIFIRSWTARKTAAL